MRSLWCFGAPALGLVAPAAAQQANDETYTAAIHEFTTEPFFLTPYVDHLPASDVVPTPLDVLGHIAGAADVLDYPEQIYRYMRAVADASPRVRVVSIGQTEEGREMIVVVVANASTLDSLETYKSMLARLADPRTVSEAEAEQLIRTAKPIYWATGAIHSPETGSPEMLMELVYRLAVDESPYIRGIRDHLIFMATPVVEVDGRAKQVDVHMAKRKDPDAVVPSRLLYWGKYVAHDNNRDGIGLSLQLSKNINRTWHEYHPTVFHDLHESASHLYISTGRGPYNAWFDPIVINEWNNLAYPEVQELTALGVPGVYTHDFYDGWAPNYMFSVAHMHNAIGRFYETQGAGDASTRVIRTNVQREWHRPNTPLREVVWSIRNNVNLQQSGLLIGLGNVSTNHETYLRNFYRKGVRSVAKARAEGPAAYVMPAGDRRPELQARLVELLHEQGVEVHRARKSFEVGERSFGAGSYVIRMDQPYSRAADMLLDKQYYNPNDPRPYDDVGWTLGPLFDVETVRIEDPSVLDVAMDLVDGSAAAAGDVEGRRNGAAFLIDYRGQNRLTAFRYTHPDLRISAAEEAFTADDREFGPGTFVIPVDGNPAALADTLALAAREFGFEAVGVRKLPEVAMHPIGAPRVAVVHTWVNTQSEGWLRIGLDEYHVAYDYISVHDVRDTPDLRSRYDVIVMAPTSLDALSVMRGVQGQKPIPWRRSDLTPNLGFNDETDDMRGGLELSGVMHLADFVRHGGLFITLTSSASIPVHFGLAEGIGIKSTPDLWARGGVFRVQIADHKSPIVYGYGDALGVYFNTAPVFTRGSSAAGRFARFRGGGPPAGDRGAEGSTTKRHTGRGGPDEEDIVQGRARDEGRAGARAFREDHAEAAANPRGRGGSTIGRRTRTLARFPRKVTDLLISGGLRNGQAMTGAPALVDAPYGEGHVVMFSFNPFWRGETVGPMRWC